MARHEELTEVEKELKVEEVRIKLPWNNGSLAGKWWGPKTQRPIVCLHGWQDNAGTFDRLIPLLPRDQSFLAIDLPGHGLSAHVPDGMAYHEIEFLGIINLLMKEYNWDKISLLGHSMGSSLSFMFASVFPKKVDLLIQIDVIKPSANDPTRTKTHIETNIENIAIVDKRNQDQSDPPAYEYETMLDRMYKATKGSITKETAGYIINRNIRRSKKYPEKFYFQRDSRLKYLFGMNFSQEVYVELAKKLKMPHIFIRALHAPFYDKREYFYEMIEVLTKKKMFECHFIDSTHHLHLTEPEKIAPILTDFIDRHRKVSSKL